MMLVLFILYARRLLVSTGEVVIEINGDPEKTITCSAGGKLLNTLADAGIFLFFRVRWWWHLRPVSLRCDGRRWIDAVYGGGTLYPR